MNDYTPVYDFEGIFEGAAQSLFGTLGFTSVDEDGNISDPLIPADVTELQRDRPRLEIVFKDNGSILNSSSGSAILDPVYGQTFGLVRAAAYEGEMHFTIAANSTETDKATIRKWRAALRWYAEQMPIRMQEGLTTLSLRSVKESGCTNLYKNSDGYWSCGIVYSVRFSIKPDALQQFQQLTP